MSLTFQGSLGGTGVSPVQCFLPMRFLKQLKISLFLVALAGGLVWGCQPGRPQAPPAQAVAAQVLDGDTVALAEGQRVRLLGLDAPELEREGRPAEFLAHKAKKALAEMVQGRRVRLEYDQLRYDHYGRLLAHVFTPEGQNAGVELVRQGLAHVYLAPPNVRFKEELLSAQREAMSARRGIWLKALKQDEPHYLANRSTYRFHRPTCRLGQNISPANRLLFDSLSDAYHQGFSPCRTCRP